MPRVFKALLGLAPLGLLLGGCAINVPPKLPEPNQKSLAKIVGVQEGDAYSYCVTVINDHLSIARTQRDLGAALSITGGLVGAGGGVTGSIVDEKTNGAKAAFTIIAASGAVVALLSPYIGNPSTHLDSFAKSKSHYDSAQTLLRKIDDVSRDMAGETDEKKKDALQRKREALLDQFDIEVHDCTSGADATMDRGIPAASAATDSSATATSATETKGPTDSKPPVGGPPIQTEKSQQPSTSGTAPLPPSAVPPR